MSWTRYVALGDSTTEGVGDPYPDGAPRGWADRLAGVLAEREPGLHYANLAVRGRLAADVRAQQLAPALALGPDLASVLAGLNDALRPGFDPARVEAELDAMVGALRGAGADVLALTVPDPARVMPLARLVRRRVLALNAAVRAVCARHGARVVDLAAQPVASDPRLWDADRLHANPEGHARIAAAAAHALGLGGADWAAPLPPPARRAPHAVARAELTWAGRHLAPWLVRRARGRSSGDGVVAKRPDLAPYAETPGGSTAST